MAPDQPDTVCRQMGIVINPSNASKKETAIALFRIMRTVAVPKKLVSGQALSWIVLSLRNYVLWPKCLHVAELLGYAMAEMSVCGRKVWLWPGWIRLG